MSIVTLCSVGCIACLSLVVAARYCRPSAFYALIVLMLLFALLLVAELFRGKGLSPGSSPFDLASLVLQRGQRYASVIVHTILEPDGKSEDVQFVCPSQLRLALLQWQTRICQWCGKAASFFRCPERITRHVAPWRSRLWGGTLRPTAAGSGTGSGNHDDRPAPSMPSFDKAVRHLKREQSLAIGFCDQLRLHSLYLQATRRQQSSCGSMDGPAESRGVLQWAKSEGWKALGDMEPKFARYTLPRILAQVDHNFARRNPKIAPRTSSAQEGSSATTALTLLERHLPDNWDRYVAETQAKIGVCAAACTILFYRRTRKTVAGGPRTGLRRLWPIATFWCALVTLYMYILAQGLPPHIHAAIRMRLIRNLQHEHQADAMEPGARLRRRLARYLVPRMSKSLFDATT